MEGDMTDLGDIQNEPAILKHSPYINNVDFKKLLKETSSNFQILSLNCQSINAKYELLKTYIDYFQESTSTLDAICLQETWLSADSDLSLLQLPGYNLISLGKSCSAHGGVCIYLKDNYEYSIINLGLTPESWDGLFIEITVQDNYNIYKKLALGNIYRPPRPNVENVKEFINDINYVFEKLKQFKLVTITGDFDINLLNFQHNTSVNDFLNNLIANGYLPKITVPTRRTQQTGTLIDNFFVKFSNNIANTTARVLQSNISDHLPYFISLEYVNCKRYASKFVRTYSSSPQQFQNFKNDICSIEARNKLKNVLKHNPHESCSTFTNIISWYIDKHFPSKYVKFKKYKHKKSKWITSAILKSILYKDKLYVKLKSLPLNSPQYQSSLINFKTYSKILKRTIQQAKKRYYDDCFQKFKTDMRKTWSTINNLLNRSKKPNDYPKAFKIDETIVSDINSIVNEFNKYFIEIGPKLSQDIEIPVDKSFKDFLKSPVQANFFFKPVKEDDVLKAIDSLKPKTSCGQDKITNKLLKYIKYEAALPLMTIMNQMFSSGIFPNSMKIAKVVPLYKKNENNVFNNYRPVSILSSVSKVFERIMHDQIYEHFSNLKLFYPSQYGFRKNHSTEFAALELVERIINEMDNNNVPINIFMDLSKAFDTLDHQILFYKLEYYGFKGKSLELLKCYLSSRSQYVEINDVQSNLLTITCGVPQGSILGPLLFIIYLNDLPYITEKLKTLVYADDTTLFASLNNDDFTTIKDGINDELNLISNWLKLNKLSLNIQKSKAMLFHTVNRQVQIPDLYIDNIKIDFADEFNFLGLVLDRNLNWKSHVNFISKKISKTVGIMTKLKNFLPRRALHNIYNALILPHFNYCAIIWGWQSNSLSKIQKKAIRTITKSRYNAHTNKLFKELNTLKIKDICALHDYKFCYKLVKNLTPVFFKENINHEAVAIHNYETRQATDLRLPAVRHEFARNSIGYRFPKIFNNMSDSYKQNIYTNSLYGFKSFIKSEIIGNYPSTCTIPQCPTCTYW